MSSPRRIIFLLFIEVCKNTLPIDYGGKNKCTWSCDQWAGIGGDGNNYCSDDWSTKRHCVPTTSGKIKDYCQASCNSESCGTIFQHVFEIKPDILLLGNDGNDNEVVR